MADCVVPTYLPASYNGVFFECIIAGSEHGRRGVTGEFPFGEQTAYQDLGIKARKFSITGRFKGPDCIAQTSALIAAVETPGPGELIHPTRGALNVAAVTIKVKDDLLQGAGETNFDIDFIDAGQGGLVGLGLLSFIPAIAGIIDSVSSSLQNNYVPEQLPFYNQAPVQQTVQAALVTLANAFYQAIPQDSPPPVYQAYSQILSSASNPDTWATEPAIEGTIKFNFAAIDAYAASPTVQYQTMKNIANTFAQTATTSGLGGDCEEALFSSLRILCAAYMLRSATQIVVKTLQEALDNLDAISTIITEELANAVATGNDELYIALISFQAMALKAMTQYAYMLPPVLSYNFKGGVPSLVAAHEIYGDCHQFQQLEDRNPLNFPYALGPTIYAIST